MEDYEKNNSLSCINNINDTQDGIIHELSLKQPYVGYLQEKVEPALHDMIVLNEIIQKMTKN